MSHPISSMIVQQGNQTQDLIQQKPSNTRSNTTKTLQIEILIIRRPNSWELLFHAHSKDRHIPVLLNSFMKEEFI